MPTTKKIIAKHKGTILGIQALLILCLVAYGVVVAGSRRSHTFVTCAGTETERTVCWTQYISKTLETEGIGEGVRALTDLYTREPLFAKNCHDAAHRLGEASFTEFTKKNTVTPGNWAAFCGYGYFHGFLDAAIQSNASPAVISDLCKKSGATPILADACFHGAGHGVMAMVAEKHQAEQPDEPKLVQEALEKCTYIVSDVPDLVNKCASGMFMELSEYKLTQKYGLLVDKANPLAICDSVQPEVKPSCYSQSNAIIAEVSGRDLIVAGRLIATIKPVQLAIDTMVSFVPLLVDTSNTRQDQRIRECRTLETALRLPCIQGIAVAFLLYGSADETYKPAATFCSSNALTETEKQSCFDMVVDYTKRLYSAETFKQICQDYLSRYSPTCTIH